MNTWAAEQLESIRILNREFSAWVDPLDPQERNALESFCDLVEELEESPIFKALLHREEVQSNVKWTNGVVVKAEIEGLNEHDLKAFLLPARLFTQKNDRCSIRKIGMIFDRRVSQRHELWMYFNANRMGLNHFLRMTVSKPPHTNREIFETFLYGHYAHRDEKWAAAYKRWKENPADFVRLQAIFVLIISGMFGHARELHKLVKQLLTLDAKLQSRQGT
jgi:hypothetical protein